MDSIGDGQRRLLEFDDTNEGAWEVGLACGKRIEVIVEKIV